MGLPSSAPQLCRCSRSGSGEVHLPLPFFSHTSHSHFLAYTSRTRLLFHNQVLPICHTAIFCLHIPDSSIFTTRPSLLPRQRSAAFRPSGSLCSPSVSLCVPAQHALDVQLVRHQGDMLLRATLPTAPLQQALREAVPLLHVLPLLDETRSQRGALFLQLEPSPSA